MSAATEVKFAILGAGPTGIGAAWRLSQNLTSNGNNGSAPFLLIDESRTPGGRAASFITPEGFTFDYGGHVLFPHPGYTEFIDLLDRVVPEWHQSTPIRGVWLDGRLIPTPVQRNIHRLPLPDLAACLWGLALRSPLAESITEPTLQQYLEAEFGKALTRRIMSPLNRKMWAHDPAELGSAWSSHRSGSKERNIPQVQIRTLLRNLLLNRDDPGWTPTTTVRYPQVGGMGTIWQRAIDLLPQRGRRLGARVCSVDAGKKELFLECGSVICYERLITSIPLDVLLRMLRDQPGLRARASDFRAARVQLFGFGLLGEMPQSLRGVHAFSVPSPQIPFWRVNLPSNFSPGNVPQIGNAWSILCESSIPARSTERHHSEQIEAAVRQMGLISSSVKVISHFSAELDHGYPVPFAGRDALLNDIQKQLEQFEIYSRGRFGGWRYEVSNQDHAFMQGVEVVDRLRENKPESTYRKTW